MQYVEAAHGAPSAPKMLHVFSTDPDVLNRRSKEQFGAMPDWIPADIRRASLRGQVHTELSPQELERVAAAEGIRVEQLKKSEDFDPYFNLKVVLVEEGGQLKVAYFEFLPPSVMDKGIRAVAEADWLPPLLDNFLAASCCNESFMIVEVPRDSAASRYEHVGKGLRRSDLDPNAIRQFANWFTAAIEAGIRDVNAMSLATAGSDARPSVRIVLLKSFDQDGFVFFSNYESVKGKQLDANPYAALGFYWIELDRQVRISGKVEKTSREESQAYFHSRPVGSQLGAWASRQSEIIDARRVLDARMAEITERFRNKRIPLPPHWGGYRLKPDKMEFWQGRPNRLHDRFRYTRQADGSWQIDRLAP